MTSTRRAVPILAVALPLLTAQSSFHTLWTFGVGGAMIASTLVAAPVSYRMLFGEHARGALIIRLAAYVGIAMALIAMTGVALPFVVGLRSSFLTSPSSLVISLGLFLVCGFGLGRDIELEAHLAREKARVRELEREAQHAQLLALRSHLDPHFLFNTLNAIAEWCRSDGEAAERAIIELAAILRAVMDGVRTPTWPLRRDIELARALGRLYSIRDPQRFVYEEDIDETVLEWEIPTMITLPLIENAWKHGPAKGHRGAVRFTVERKSPEELCIRVRNSGPYRGRRQGGEGIATIERRLTLTYGARARLHIESVGNDTSVVLCLPTTDPMEAIS